MKTLSVKVTDELFAEIPSAAQTRRSETPGKRRIKAHRSGTSLRHGLIMPERFELSVQLLFPHKPKPRMRLRRSARPFIGVG
jgi:hypothetical protein